MKQSIKRVLLLLIPPLCSVSSLLLLFFPFEALPVGAQCLIGLRADAPLIHDLFAQRSCLRAKGDSFVELPGWLRQRQATVPLLFLP
ncbi:hypothetical protein BDBG_17749 [Blastomyces gilchristii SLH14081]|uniref:Uncharacterized protein n=2 Tax=Blastomyces TaxID=229219 RepID=A0A179V1C1_BLAGS|nr:uncharacterized protein BDBG_17749 [Blastomyces gilchristii SLH14081]KMW68031.1 hypothetical protein BDDG_12536 [Blastomyces dermatitidis ATCC 18188]OAT13197.1 hypothetical protein BDBG_17749 [Blastomyces gilchristii SLH14081]